MPLSLKSSKSRHVAGHAPAAAKGDCCSLRPSSWGRQPARDRAACSGSRRARWCSLTGSHGRRDQPRHLHLLSEKHVHGPCRSDKGKGLTVVALLALGAVAGHVSEAAAGVAGLASAAAAAAAASAAISTTESTAIAASHCAVTGDVADLAALVALLAASAAAHAHAAGWTAHGTAGGGLCALAGQVTKLVAAVAARRLLLSGRLLALARKMALLAAVVAGRVTLGGAVTGLVRSVAAYTFSGQLTGAKQGKIEASSLPRIHQGRGAESAVWCACAETAPRQEAFGARGCQRTVVASTSTAHAAAHAAAGDQTRLLEAVHFYFCGRKLLRLGRALVAGAKLRGVWREHTPEQVENLEKQGRMHTSRQVFARRKRLFEREDGWKEDEGRGRMSGRGRRRRGSMQESKNARGGFGST
ncbi:hypothetical protein FH972_022207 [Carpinus fangiana]|uniref:Uncharacterized protein n=1 Tax=Carpinus fangiana TaxID=176857 RepID=A0A5N6KS73_9ROSI|nr:hypothetical protein FH972_022207 [Carpinus fangiana]